MPRVEYTAKANEGEAPVDSKIEHGTFAYDNVPIPLVQFLGRALLEATKSPPDRIVLKGNPAAYFLDKAKVYAEPEEIVEAVTQIFSKLTMYVHEDLDIADGGPVTKVMNIVLHTEKDVEGRDAPAGIKTKDIIVEDTAKYIAAIGFNAMYPCRRS